MDESEIRELVESREYRVDATANWLTPAGNQRSAPVYEAEVRNEYLKKHRTLKAKSVDELQVKVNECLEAWAEQEIRKRIVEGKRDKKEQAQGEAQRLDKEAIEALAEAAHLLATTLAVDDRIDWEAERDTRAFKQFSFSKPPLRPAPTELALPPKPGFTWLFRGRLRRWEDECKKQTRLHETLERKAVRDWQEAVQRHEQEKQEAKDEHERQKAQFLADQVRANEALVEFRRAFEAGDVSAIVEYCSRVLERSQYPDWLVMSNQVAFDEESGFVAIELELPPPDTTPTTEGYKFVSRGNKVEPVPLKKKEAEQLYESILDQLVLRTVHEIIEGCDIDTVKGVLLNGWVTSVNKATGNDSRKRVRTVVTDRATFEAVDLARIDPASCIQHLGEGVSQMDEADK